MHNRRLFASLFAGMVLMMSTSVVFATSECVGGDKGSYVVDVVAGESAGAGANANGWSFYYDKVPYYTASSKLANANSDVIGADKTAGLAVLASVLMAKIMGWKVWAYDDLDINTSGTCSRINRVSLRFPDDAK